MDRTACLKTPRKFLALLLSMVLVIGLFPMAPNAMAEEANGETGYVATETTIDESETPEESDAPDENGAPAEESLTQETLPIENDQEAIPQGNSPTNETRTGDEFLDIEDASQVSIKLDGSNLDRTITREYTGKPITFRVVVTNLSTGEKLVENQDYYLTYTNNLMPGTNAAGVVFKGIEENGVTGYIAKNFSIVKSAANEIPLPGAWKWRGNGYRWIQDNGGYPKSSWLKIDGKRYRVDANGYRASGWKVVSGYRYYFSTSTGAMAKGLWTIGGNRYFLDSNNGRLKTGLWTVNGKKYYFSPNSSPKGKAVSGWKTINGTRYYFSPSTNTACKGMWTIKGKRYLFNSDTAALRTGWWTVNGKKYYFSPKSSPKGAAVTGGFKKVGDYKYFFYADGHIAINQWVNGRYFNSKGRYQIVRPKLDVYCLEDTYYSTDAVGFVVENNGGGTVTILNERAYLWDNDYYSYDRNLKLANENMRVLSSQKVTPGEIDTVFFKVVGDSTWYDANTKIYFNFKYCGVKWRGYASYNYGFSCWRI